MFKMITYFFHKNNAFFLHWRSSWGFYHDSQIQCSILLNSYISIPKKETSNHDVFSFYKSSFSIFHFTETLNFVPQIWWIRFHRILVIICFDWGTTLLAIKIEGFCIVYVFPCPSSTKFLCKFVKTFNGFYSNFIYTSFFFFFFRKVTNSL